MAVGLLFRRFFYLTILIGNSYFLYIVIRNIWKSHVTKSLSFTVDTNYLHWTTTFPAISICEIFNAEKMWDLNEKIYGPDRNKFFDDIMTDVTFFSGHCYSCKKCATEKEFCEKLSLNEITTTFRTSCHKLLGECKWNGEPFDCCDAFIELQSEFGVCYTINSMHTKPQFGRRLLSDRLTPGKLELTAFEDVELYLHSTEDVPSKSIDRNLHETILWGVQKSILFGVQEIINEEDVVSAAIAQRRCQFTWEMKEGDGLLFDFHSYTTCMVQCSFNIQLDVCGCVHHLMPKSSSGNVTICGFEGLTCLTDNYERITERRRKSCNCLISCTEQEINIIYSSNDLTFNQLGTKITVAMLDLPKMRYIRKIVRSTLDFIISLGGIFGLLFGASIITIIEVLFKIYHRIIDYCLIKK